MVNGGDYNKASYECFERYFLSFLHWDIKQWNQYFLSKLTHYFGHQLMLFISLSFDSCQSQVKIWLNSPSKVAIGNDEDGLNFDQDFLKNVNPQNKHRYDDSEGEALIV